jgi:hypothetical protein
MTTSLIAPVLALVTWTLVVWVWMYATRLPAIQAAGMKPDDAKHTDVLRSLPSNVRQVADNYNHLHEQPTLFYAAALALTVGGLADGLSLTLAWAYVAARVAHSIVQNTFNAVAARFAVFTLGTLILAVLAVRGLLAAL